MSLPPPPPTTSFPVVVADEHGDCVSGLAKAYADAAPATTATPPPSPPPHPEVLLHFDSHPDLDSPSLPRAVLRRLLAPHGGSSDSAAARLALCAPYVDVATWLLPAVACLRLRRIVWVKPEWSAQMEPGLYSLALGAARDGRRFAVRPAAGGGGGDARFAGCAAYWRASGVWVEEEEEEVAATDLLTFDLLVVNWGGRGGCSSSASSSSASPSGGAASGETILNECCAAGARPTRVLLDVDEDFFSCENPVRRTLEAFHGAAVCAAFDRLFGGVDTEAHPGFFATLRRYVAQRVHRLANAASRRRHPACRELAALFARGEQDEEEFAGLCRTVRGAACGGAGSVYKADELLRFADMHELPEHVSTAAHINEALAGVLEEIVAPLMARGAAVSATLAMSVADGYTPSAQAPFIHDAVVEGLERLCAANGLRPRMVPCLPHHKQLLVDHPWMLCAACPCGGGSGDDDGRLVHVTYELNTSGAASYPAGVVKYADVSGVYLCAVCGQEEDDEEEEEEEEDEEDEGMDGELPDRVPWEAVRSVSRGVRAEAWAVDDHR